MKYIVVLFFALFLVACDTPVSSPPTAAPTAEPTPATRTITYIVTGRTNRGSATMQTPSGIQQEDIDTLRFGTNTPFDDRPLSYEFEANSGEFVSISVQNGNDSGTITCTILSDGRQIAQNTSSGAFVIASCDATVP